MFGRQRKGNHVATRADAPRPPEPVEAVAAPEPIEPVAPIASTEPIAPVPERERVVPPVDLDQPVTNPELLARLEEAARTGVWDATTMQAVVDGVYLLASQISGPGVVDGVMQEGTQIGILSAADDQERQTVAAFTDWVALREAVGDDPSWSAIVETGQGVLAMAMSAEHPGGLVINPGSPASAFALPQERLRELFPPAV